VARWFEKKRRGLASGLNGFVLPIMYGALVDITGVRSSTFMLLSGSGLFGQRERGQPV
jgi:nitrate/nitrite transporter NarK